MTGISVGTTLTNKYGLCKVIEIGKRPKVLVSFEDLGQVKWCSWYDLLREKLKVNIPTIHGVGIVDVRGVTGTITYERWRSMLDRCYGSKENGRHPDYIGVTVCKEWHTFSNFKGWVGEGSITGLQLDKDLLSGGASKLYSPNTCCLIPGWLNTLLGRHHIQGKPIGVSICKTRNKYLASGYRPQRRFDCPLEAQSYWRLSVIDRLTDYIKTSDQRDHLVLDALQAMVDALELDELNGNFTYNKLPTMMSGSGAVPFINIK